MTYKFWTNVGVAMASSAGLGAAVSVSGITKANPAVLSYTGTDPSNGDVVMLSVSGMTQVNRRLFKVANVNTTANTFELQGEDSTAYSTLAASGNSFQLVTFNTSFSTLSEPQGSGGDPVFEDTTLIHDAGDTQAVVSSSAQSYEFTSKWLPGDAALVEANKAFNQRSPRPVKITFADGSTFMFSGYVIAPLLPATSGKKVTTKVGFSLEAAGTSYA